MQAFPDTPPVDEAPDVFERGHLWLVERVDGSPLRFAVERGGWLAFGDDDTVYRDGEVPPRYRHAVRHVRETIDRDALADLPADATCFGVATVRRRIDYDWERLPPFLGTDIHVPDRGFLAPDVVERAFEELGLAPVNALEKEVPARHFDPASYDVPPSNWYDGPPLGVVIRNKSGGRAALSTPGFDPAPPAPADADPAALAAEYTTPELIEAAIDAAGGAADREAIGERVVERVLRERHAAIHAADRPVDEAAVVDAIEAATREYLAGRSA